jgi:virginiamycin B lyase
MRLDVAGGIVDAFYSSRITAGPDGALWFTDSNGDSIGRITASGAIRTYTDPSIQGPSGITAGLDGALWFTNVFGDSFGRMTTSGEISSYGGAVHYPARAMVTGLEPQ